MKYIRTKDGIKAYNESCDLSYVYQCIGGIKIADNIEELCDCFVYSDEVFKNVIYNNFHALKILLKLRKNYVVYGAVWCDKGLIYVAKMNEKGCLELI